MKLASLLAKLKRSALYIASHPLSALALLLRRSPKLRRADTYELDSYAALEALNQIHHKQLRALFDDFSKQAALLMETQAKDRSFLVEVTELNLRANVKNLHTICKQLRSRNDTNSSSESKKKATRKRSKKRGKIKGQRVITRAKRKLTVEVCDAYYGFMTRRSSLLPAERLTDKELVQLVLTNLPLFKRQKVSTRSIPQE